jgi:hypothetical protein
MIDRNMCCKFAHDLAGDHNGASRPRRWPRI